jgi:hypothetical protein
MAASTESLNILIKAKDLYSSELGRMQKSFKVAGTAIAGSIALIGGVLIKAAKETAKLGDEFQKMSIRTGVSTQALSELSHVAQLSGTNIETVEKAIFRMSKVANDSEAGLSTAERTLDQLGITVKDVNGNLKDNEQLFFESIDALRKVENQTKRTALAQEIFGKSGTKLLTIVNESSESVANLRKEAQDLGITFSQQAADDAAKFNDEILRLEQSVNGLSLEIGKTLIPILTTSAQWWKENLAAVRNYFDETDGRELTELNQALEIQIKNLKEAREELKNFGGDKSTVIIAIKEEIALINVRRAAILAEQNDRKKARDKSRETTSTATEDDKSKDAAKKQKALDADLAAFVKNLDLELAALNAKNIEEREIILAQQEFLDEVRRQEVQKEKDAIAMKRKLNVDAGKNAIALLDSLNTIADGKNRAIFDALKLARAGEAIVNTYAGANQAMASLPYPYNLVAAGTVIAAGLANLAVIQRTQFGSTSAGGGSTTAPVTAPLAAPTQTGIDTGQSTGTQNITINIEGVLNAEDVVNLVETVIIPAINASLDRNATTLNVR